MLRSFIVFFIFLAHLGHAQQLSENSEVRLITCGVGDQLHSLFGHSAIHISDPINKIDHIYNYGTFNFDTPNFYLKFAQGRLDYYLSVKRSNGLERFIFNYQVEGRSVDMQVLNLDQVQRQKVFEFLENNAKEENKYYAYDFFFDNCATRIHDVFGDVFTGELELAEPEGEWEITFRQMIWRYLEPQPWSQFGIDLVLGSPIDATMTLEETMFHPEYVYKIYEGSTINGKPIVTRTQSICPQLLQPADPGFFTPDTVFWGVLILAMLITFMKWQVVAGYFDAIFFTSLGLLGCVLIFMWWGTDHVATKGNYNLIWANPIHLLIPIVIGWTRLKLKFVKLYLVMTIITFAVILFWFVLPQQFNPAFAPIILTLAMRYYFLYRTANAVKLAQ